MSVLSPTEGTVDLSDRQTQSAIASVAFICKLYISESSRICPESLYEVVRQLHNIILTVSDFSETLQDDISQLCELWFLQERDGRESISPQMISYLLALALSNFNAKDANRVIACQEALKDIDIDDPSSESLRILIQRCFLHSHFLQKEKGRKFLVYLFNLTPNLIEPLHMTIKSALVACNIPHAEIFADIYFRTWRSSDGLFRIKIENCLQNFIHLTIHSANTVLLRNSKIILKQFIDNKASNRDIEEMLERLYSPILWKSMEVANPIVRENALFQFALVFPLIRSDSRQREVDNHIQEQLNLLIDCLSDTHTNVRKQAVLSSGRILSLYWELLPYQVISTILEILCGKLAFDASSFSVREAVLKAIISILQNYLSHSTLKECIHRLAPLLNDTNEKVRINMIHLLETISMKTNIEFYRFVSVEDLLKALGCEPNKKNQLAISRLLVPTYWPSEIENYLKERVRRCANVVEADRNAAIVFYSNLNLKKAPLVDVVFFLRYVWKKLVCAWIKGLNEGGEKGRKKQKIRDTLDKDSILTLLRIIVVVWEKIDSTLASSGDVQLVQKLVSVFTDDFMNSLADQIDHISVFRIAAHLPSSLIPNFVKRCQESLLKSKFQQQYLECLFTWKEDFADTILQDINRGLSTPFEEGEIDIDIEIEKNLNLLLSIMNGDNWLLEEMVSSDILEDTLSIMKKYLGLAKGIIHMNSSIDVDIKNIITCIDIYYRLLFHSKIINAQKHVEYIIQSELEELIDWVNQHVIPQISTDLEEERLNIRIQNDDYPKKLESSFLILKPLLLIVCDYYVMGFSGNVFGSKVLKLIQSLLSSYSSLELCKYVCISTWKVMLNYWFRYPSTDIFEDSEYILKDENTVLEILKKVIERDNYINDGVITKNGLKAFKIQMKKRKMTLSFTNIQDYISNIESEFSKKVEVR